MDIFKTQVGFYKFMAGVSGAAGTELWRNLFLVLCYFQPNAWKWEETCVIQIVWTFLTRPVETRLYTTVDVGTIPCTTKTTCVWTKTSVGATTSRKRRRSPMVKHTTVIVNNGEKLITIMRGNQLKSKDFHLPTIFLNRFIKTNSTEMDSKELPNM